ncbi:MAG: energy transducer TonB [Acidobacteria bacterium]|nr:energy transducer TonB [Acidobacteriota bacterium]
MKNLILKITVVISTFAIGIGAARLSPSHVNPSPRIQLHHFPDVYSFNTSTTGTGTFDGEHVSPINGFRSAFRGCGRDSMALLKAPPHYPQYIKEERLSGLVNVKIMVDETGEVIRASALCGHSSLQQAAVTAAYQEHFSPLIIDGRAVRAVGVIAYDYKVDN